MSNPNGHKISLSSNPIPPGKICVLSGYSQAAAAQFALVQDQNGTVVAKITSAGGSGALQHMTASGGAPASFTANNGPYTISIGYSDSQYSQVLKQYQTIAGETTTYVGSWLFISEDGADKDFNDSTVTLTWNLFSG